MIVHNFKDSDIRKGDTLGSPKHLTNGELDTFDRVIANPPFSLKKWWPPAEVNVKIDAKGTEITPKYADIVSDNYGRFKYGVPPRGYGELAFLQHMLLDDQVFFALLFLFFIDKFQEFRNCYFFVSGGQRLFGTSAFLRLPMLQKY